MKKEAEIAKLIIAGIRCSAEEKLTRNFSHAMNDLRHVDRDYEISIPDRELSCLYLSANGKSAKQIADILGLKKTSVDTYIKRVKQRLNAKSTSHAVLIAIRRGLIG